MKAPLTHVVSEICSRPLLVMPSYAEAIMAAIAPRAGIDFEVDMSRQFAARDGSRDAQPMDPWEARGIAYIPIMGSIAHRGSYMDAMSGMASYKTIGAQLDSARANPNVHAILTEYDTPGGSVSGAFDLADKIREISAVKPIVAFADGLMCSAGYLLGSQSSFVFASQTSQIGSIGCVMTHIDKSKALANEGLNVSFIFAGDHKVDGNSTGPLPDSVRQEIQAEVDAAYEQFLQAVGTGRGSKFSAEDARATQAGIFSASASVDNSLIDGIMTFEAAVEFTTRQAETRRKMIYGW